MLSLEKKLPLLISGLALLVLLSTAAIAVTEVRRSERMLAEQRLERVNLELAELVERGLRNRIALLDSVAASPAVRAVLAGGDPAEAEPALARLQVAADSGAPIQLLDGERRIRMQLQGGRFTTPTSGERVPEPHSELGLIENAGGRSVYWVERPVGAGRPVGWVRQLRRAGSRAAAESIGELIGARVGIFIGHRDGGLWASLSGEPVEPPATFERLGLLSLRVAGEARLARADTLASHPWVIVSTLPAGAVLERSGVLMRRLGVLGAVLLVLAGVAAWAITRGVTAPLRELGRAADAIARGDHGVRAQVQRSDELGRLAQSFNEMAAHVDTARSALELGSQAKSEFLATMSHEVRTPINAVIGYADLLDAGTAGELTAAQRTFVERIRESGRHLTSVVDEVLDFSKIEAGGVGLHLQAVSAAEAIRSAAGLISAQAQTKQLELRLETDSDCTVTVDVQRLRQVLINLLSNAVKFTPAGGRITAACRSATPPAVLGTLAREWVALTVQDTGAGVPEDQHERIFEPFVQASGGYTREHGGTGLGLAISRRLTRVMGGDITVESTPGGGATFTVWLPVAPAPHPAPQPA